MDLPYHVVVRRLGGRRRSGGRRSGRFSSIPTSIRLPVSVEGPYLRLNDLPPSTERLNE